MKLMCLLKGERTDDFLSFDDVIADVAETFLGDGNDLRLFCTEEETETVKAYFEHENALFFFYEPYQCYSLYNMAETIFKRYSDYVLT